MNRRGFILSVSGSLVTVPFVGRAQVPTRARRIGVLSPGPAAGEEFEDTLAAMQALGWIEGKNIFVEPRSAGANLPRLLPLADELVALKVDVVVTYGTEATAAAKNATTSIPIVMASAGDPVGMGLVATLAHPGGNITGYSTLHPEIASKRAALLHELLPRARRVCVIINPVGQVSDRLRARTDAAYRSLGLESFLIEVASESQFLDALAEAARQRADALDINLSIITDAFIQALLRSRLPAIVNDRDIVDAGGLLSFAPDPNERNRRVAAIIDKVLRGAKPADLPIEQPSKFELVINTKAAKALDLTIPRSLLLRADEVIR
jgi:putative tryptophan/tyrosine transport system substrate-binding protein